MVNAKIKKNNKTVEVLELRSKKKGMVTENALKIKGLVPQNPNVTPGCQHPARCSAWIILQMDNLHVTPMFPHRSFQQGECGIINVPHILINLHHQIAEEIKTLQSRDQATKKWDFFLVQIKITHSKIIQVLHEMSFLCVEPAPVHKRRMVKGEDLQLRS